MTRAFFITGTDTGIGKTVAACALLRAFNARGLRAVGMKPVAAGCDVTPEGWRPGDDVLLPPYQDQDSALDAAGDACWFHRTRPDKHKEAGK